MTNEDLADLLDHLGIEHKTIETNTGPEVMIPLDKLQTFIQRLHPEICKNPKKLMELKSLPQSEWDDLVKQGRGALGLPHLGFERPTSG